MKQVRFKQLVINIKLINKINQYKFIINKMKYIIYCLFYIKERYIIN